MSNSSIDNAFRHFNKDFAELRKQGFMTNTAVINQIYDQITNAFSKGIYRKKLHEKLHENEIISLSYKSFLTSYYKVKKRFT